MVRDEAFPFIKTMGDTAAGSTYAQHMKDAVFLIGSPALLDRVIEQIDKILELLEKQAAESQDRTYVDLMGDLYEYMLSKLTQAGQNGQFRTPRHIAAPHYSHDGGVDGTGAEGGGVRSGLRHGGFFSGGGGVFAGFKECGWGLGFK